MRNSIEFENIKKRLGLAVKKNRLSRALTQEELASKIGMGSRHLQKIEAGEVNITLLTLMRLAVSFEIDPATLLCAEEEL